MRPSPATFRRLIVAALALAPHAFGQLAFAPADAPYRLNVSVDEVILTFHAADAHGLPINDLTLSDLTLLDNGLPPARILDFQLQQNFPIRAGILIDTSASMSSHLFRDQSIATEYAQHLLRQQTDQAFILNFDRTSHLIQSWTSSPATLTTAIHTTPHADPIGGTALYDALYAACRSQFGEIDHRSSGNFILLFSDGEENASFLDLETAVDMCQRTNTALYAFSSNPHDGSLHAGTSTLAQLATQTGGVVFHDNDPDLSTDLRTIESSLRNHYRLVFRPTTLAHDGAFHPIVLATPDRVATLTIRSGYYAPKPKRPAATNAARPAPPSPDR
ncbi:MAG TPA: VWA domain-containing protein [Acidobacteriaceae bacterium]|jgi:Ca-activated chloride channel family protein|nr:VWA domain-containing protein [Acidobacteriaceae bacterium]